MTRVTINYLSQVFFEIEGTFSGWHQLLLFGSLNNPLALLTISGSIHLDGFGVVILAVSFQNFTGVIQITDVFTAKYAGTR